MQVQHALDPITASVVEHAMFGVTDEMAHVIISTAYSPLVFLFLILTRYHDLLRCQGASRLNTLRRASLQWRQVRIAVLSRASIEGSHTFRIIPYQNESIRAGFHVFLLQQM